MTRSDKFLGEFLLAWNLLVMAFWVVGLRQWAILWVWIEASVGAGEWISVQRTGRTITQKFRAWAGTHRWQAILILVGMALAWGTLLAHLGVR